MNQSNVRTTNQSKPLKPRTYQSKKKDQDRNNYYARGIQHNEIDHTVEIGLVDHNTEENYSLDRILGVKIEETLQITKCLIAVEVGIEIYRF